MDPQQGQPALQIGDYLATLRLRRWLVLAIAAVFTIGGVLYSLTLKPSYVATSEVLLSAETDPSGTVTTEISPDTEAQVATSPDVAVKAKSLFETDMQPTELIKSVAVSLPADSFILDFKFTAPTPAEAQAGANAFADAYLDFKAEQFQQGIDAQVASVDAALNQLGTDRHYCHQGGRGGSEGEFRVVHSAGHDRDDQGTDRREHSDPSPAHEHRAGSG